VACRSTSTESSAVRPTASIDRCPASGATVALARSHRQAWSKLSDAVTRCFCVTCQLRRQLTSSTG